LQKCKSLFQFFFLAESIIFLGYKTPNIKKDAGMSMAVEIKIQ
jgi:hypothetical protein